ncbi:hypothetical protein [uncultured Methylobacterium sp.]|uniref:hypothetical protein n=1 Tax=uncultured Methylobacterium sp. TaxID=157278 RepID=UPI0035CB6617
MIPPPKFLRLKFLRLKLALLPRAAATALLVLFASTAAQAADGCDALTARMIRATGASLAGRAGTIAIFRAADANRLSLECGKPRRMVFGALEREPRQPYFALIGLAAEGLTGARAEAVEVLALNLHQRSLLTQAPAEGRAGKAALRCETGPREDSLSGNHTVCVLVPARPVVLRRRAGLPAGAAAG